MSRADHEVTGTDRPAPDETQLRQSRQPDCAGLFIGVAPSDTLRACANVCRFVSDAVDSMGHCGVQFGDGSSDAICRIMTLVADVIDFEAKRAPYERRPESELAEEGAE